MRIIATIITLGVFLTNGGYLKQKEHRIAKVDEGALATQHTKDPTECKTVCAPPGYDGKWPEEFPDDARKITCAGDYCAKSEHGHKPGEQDEQCKAHYSCDVHCSEVCCVCLRECI